jgi:hypothetical protein
MTIRFVETGDHNDVVFAAAFGNQTQVLCTLGDSGAGPPWQRQPETGIATSDRNA